MVGKGKLAVFESSSISEIIKATPTKIGLHAFHINLYLHEFFELILFFDPHRLYMYMHTLHYSTYSPLTVLIFTLLFNSCITYKRFSINPSVETSLRSANI